MAKINIIDNKSAPITIDPSTASDSYIQYDVNAVNQFRVGVDVTDNSYRLSRGAALGTNDTFVISSTGQRTMPLQPAFLAVLNTTVNNITGANVDYTMVWDTELFDQGGDFSSTTFTAPITGKYKLESSVLAGGLGAANTLGQFFLVTSNREYTFQISAAAIRTSGNQASFYESVLADMDAADVASVRIRISSGTQVVDVIGTGSATPSCWFSGNLEV